MRRHLQKLVHLLCGKYEEQQAERHQDSMETQQVLGTLACCRFQLPVLHVLRRLFVWQICCICWSARVVHVLQVCEGLSEVIGTDLGHSMTWYNRDQMVHWNNSVKGTVR